MPLGAANKKSSPELEGRFLGNMIFKYRSATFKIFLKGSTCNIGCGIASTSLLTKTQAPLFYSTQKWVVVFFGAELATLVAWMGFVKVACDSLKKPPPLKNRKLHMLHFGNLGEARVDLRFRSFFRVTTKDTPKLSGGRKNW